MKPLLLALCTLSLSACQAPPPPADDPIRPVLLFTDENGVKVYGFFYNGYTRCYAVGGSMAGYIRSSKNNHADSDAPTVEIDPRQARIAELQAEIDRLRKGVK